jgi:hypothetical protein
MSIDSYSAVPEIAVIDGGRAIEKRSLGILMVPRISQSMGAESDGDWDYNLQDARRL